jgi:hypothetical protein
MLATAWRAAGLEERLAGLEARTQRRIDRGEYSEARWGKVLHGEVEEPTRRSRSQVNDPAARKRRRTSSSTSDRGRRDGPSRRRDPPASRRPLSHVASRVEETSDRRPGPSKSRGERQLVLGIPYKFGPAAPRTFTKDGRLVSRKP